MLFFLLCIMSYIIGVRSKRPDLQAFPATTRLCPTPIPVRPLLYFRDSNFFVCLEGSVSVPFRVRALCLKDGFVNAFLLQEVYFLFMFEKYPL